MQPGTDLPTALAALTDALDHPDVNLHDELIRLGTTAGQAVISYLGLTVTASVEPGLMAPLILVAPATSWTDTARTSIRLLAPQTAPPPSVLPPSIPPEAAPHRAQFGAAAGGTTARATVAITLYAATPGAFVDLAADLAHTYGISLGEVEVDSHLPAPKRQDGRTPDGAGGALADMSLINQALGVLIGHGHDPDTAYLELTRQAAATGVTLPVAALAVLEAAQR